MCGWRRRGENRREKKKELSISSPIQRTITAEYKLFVTMIISSCSSEKFILRLIASKCRCRNMISRFPFFLSPPSGATFAFPYSSFSLCPSRPLYAQYIAAGESCLSLPRASSPFSAPFLALHKKTLRGHRVRALRCILPAGFVVRLWREHTFKCQRS